MNYQETIAYLYNSLPMYQRVGSVAFKKDLANTLLLCTHLGHPERKFRSVHVAGTNGKGSTSHALAAVLQSAGYKTGLYTSPHLKKFTERIRINGEAIGEDEVVRFVADNRAKIAEISPSFFEMTVAMAFDHFAINKVDIAIIEVGLGGRLDSTNVITPELCVITNIDYDHQAMLGDTLPAIAAEKAGIIKPNVPVIVSVWQKEVAEVFAQKAGENKAELIYPDYDIKDTRFSLHDLTMDFWQQGRPLYMNLQTDLHGNYQVKNIPGVLKALEVLIRNGYKISESHIRNGLAQVKSLTGLKGRWQVLAEEPLTICDTGHNESGIRELAKKLSSESFHSLYVIFGMVNDKPSKPVLRWLPKEAFYYFCQASIPRALDARILAGEAKELGLKGEVEPDVNLALAKAREKAGKNDLIFIGGSNFVVAEINEL